MYSIILDALYELNNVKTEAEQAAYLQSLQPYAKALRESYDPSQGHHVNVDYRDPQAQAAYLIRYFPQYSQILPTILNELRYRGISVPFEKGILSLASFGCGPAPEIYGLIQFLNNYYKDITRIRAHTFDILAQEWTYSRSINEQKLIPDIWRERKVRVDNTVFDLATENGIDVIESSIKTSQLVTFQNCLNEVSPLLHRRVINNLRSIVQVMQQNALMIVIDLSGYEQVLNLIARIQVLVDAGPSASIVVGLTDRVRRHDAKQMIDNMPLIIKENLLTGIPKIRRNGLIPKRWTNYHYLAIRKN